MSQTTSQATRSCVGCRQLDERDVLLRFIALTGPGPAQEPSGGAGGSAPAPAAHQRSGGRVFTIVPDVRRRGPGRGVSVHPRYRCLQAAVQSGAFKRAFRGPAEVSARELADSAARQYERRAEGLIVAARRARKLVAGTEAVREAIAMRKVSLLVIASDAEGSREELERAVERLGRACLVWNTKQGLGHLFARATLSTVAVLDDGIADELRSAVRSAAELAEDQ